MATSGSFNYGNLNNQLAPGATSIQAANGSAGGNAQSASSAQSMQSNFLTLLTAQLNAQDPLNPMDNSQITSQMAQISQVAGIQSLNQTMQQLVNAQSANQSMMAASMIGKNVLVAGSGLQTPAAGQTTQAGVMLNGPASSVQIGGTTTATAYNTQQVQAVSWVNGAPMLVLPGNAQVSLSSVAQMS
ncbi:flagellar hook capping FlgD N-terminal domain-containing protein (plasmid) [Chromobacterium amazonense]|uniref:flagellar hook assembly protein FlgD n=1 Tax=Chromobacterium amazonense TaxID=1382803 RepID=UPI00237D78E3|nr:flagellar hook capping FlgD N-terminal domain-containing protein [Chromobacterium amazonense]MDE1711484.1 flagellar hook capping FlgD N-terminal domain-containing protein [Chromobacterium amazonense]